ncbi:MAG: inner membrane-spanning protein YciB [Hyphomicrobiaceae bacterium]
MSLLKRIFPFTAKQSINILSEFGPLVTMFVMNAAYDINTGTWALIITTVMAIAVMVYMFRRPPIFPLIASTVTIVFGALTIVTGDPMWVQIKVTIFNLMFALFLFGGLWFDRNFFKYVFEGTFHYSKEGWDKFTKSFAWFFVFTAVANEIVRLSFVDTEVYNILGYEMSGVNVWILFKIALIMPASGIYAWMLTRIMHKHRLPDDDQAAGDGGTVPAATTKAERLAAPKVSHTDKVMRTAVAPARS